MSWGHRQPMRILVSNDDGIEASGLIMLAKALASVHDVYVVAPDRERSASSHAITMHKPLYPKLVNWHGPVQAVWKVNGTPADCVKLGVEALVPDRPEMVFSGINHGSNLGRDVFYSGTVSAAMEGMFLNVPAVALSAKSYSDQDLAWIAQFVTAWTVSGQFVVPPAGQFLNVNFPDFHEATPEKLTWVKLGRREYQDDLRRYTNPRGQTYFWLSGEPRDHIDDVQTDVAAVQRGFIAVTPLSMSVTAEDTLAQSHDLTVAEVSRDTKGQP